jgi:ABC-type amino acid transport substrate-binding protein
VGTIRRSRQLRVIVGELTSGALDVVCSAATVTEERRQEVDFRRPHLSLALAVVRREDRIGGIDLGRWQVGVRRGTTAEARVRHDGTAASLRISESNDELYRELAAGAIAAVVDDSPIAGYFSRLVPGLRVAGALQELTPSTPS